MQVPKNKTPKISAAPVFSRLNGAMKPSQAPSSNSYSVEEDSFEKHWAQNRGTPGWYCLRSRRKQEFIAAAHLKALPNVQVFCPRVQFRRRSNVSGKSMLFAEALFPGHFFARFPTTEILAAVEQLSGIRGSVCFNEKHAVMEEKVIAALRAETKAIVNGLAAGDRVRLTNCGVSRLEAVITHILSADERVQTLLDFFLSEMTAEASLKNASMSQPGLTILRFSTRFRLISSNGPFNPSACKLAELAEPNLPANDRDISKGMPFSTSYRQAIA
jgi:transcription antitermination factor NusG